MLDPITLAAATQALDVASLRQRVIAANIANAQTPGYVAQQVVFESYLDEARENLRRGQRLSAEPLPAAQVVDEEVSASALPDAATVHLDAEVAALARNGVQYQALIKAINGQYAMMDMAMNGGKS